MASGSLSPTAIVAEIVLDAEAERVLDAMRLRNLRGKVEEKGSLEERDLAGRRATEAMTLELYRERDICIDAESGVERKMVR